MGLCQQERNGGWTAGPGMQVEHRYPDFPPRPPTLSTTHTIDYQSVAGWIAPASQTVSTSSGLTTTLESFYTEATSAPQIFTVTNSFGSLTGGTLVDITGANLSGPVTVSFGGVPATTVNVISSTEITAVAPPQTTGSTVSLEVSTGSGAAIQTNS